MLNQGRGAPLSIPPPCIPQGSTNCFAPRKKMFSSYTILLNMHMNFTSIHPIYSLSSFTISFLSFYVFFFSLFLVADMQLYKRLCPSVGPLVGPLVRHARVEKWENAHFRPCPPVRNWWPCIRPCSSSSSFFFISIPLPSRPSSPLSF